MPTFSISLTDAENGRVDEVRAEMQKMFVGVSISKNDVVKYLMFGRSDKHKARLWDIFLEFLTADVAEALDALGVDGNDITTVLQRLSEAHAKSRELHLPKWSYPALVDSTRLSPTVLKWAAADGSKALSITGGRASPGRWSWTSD